jgi:hypothetical protein
MHRFLAVPFLLSFTSLTVFAAADSGLLALIPAQSKIVTGVNVQQARSSIFGQFLLQQINSDPGNGFDKMAQETGFDPRRDLQSFLFASSGPGIDDAQPRFVILARGTFDAQPIRKHIVADGGAVQTTAGVDVFVAKTRRHQQQAFALPDTGIAVFGDLVSVQEVIANRVNPSQVDPALQALISKISAENDAWFASILPGSYLTRHVDWATNQQVKSQALALQSVRQAAGGVSLGDLVQFTFDAVTRSPQDAVSLQDVMRFMASFVQMQRQQDPRFAVFASSFDNMTLSASGDHLHASLAVPEKTLEQVAELGTPAAPHHGGFKPVPHNDFR